MKILKDINGKNSSKRYAGWLIVICALTMGFLSSKLEINETLIISFLTAGSALLVSTVLESKKKI